MKSMLFVLACFLLAMAASLRAAENAPTTKPSLEEENQALRAALAAQQKELTSLKVQLHAKEQELAAVQMKQRLATMPQLPQAQQPFTLVPSMPRDLPQGAVPQQFNGSTYYLVPLNENPPVLGKVQTIEVHETVAPIAPRGGDLIDDRTGTTRKAVHGK